MTDELIARLEAAMKQTGDNYNHLLGYLQRYTVPMQERNRQTGRTTALIDYACSVNAMFIVYTHQAASQVARKAPKLFVRTVCDDPNEMIRGWYHAKRPVIVVDHVVWDYASESQLESLVRFLKHVARVNHKAELITRDAYLATDYRPQGGE